MENTSTAAPDGTDDLRAMIALATMADFATAFAISTAASLGIVECLEKPTHVDAIAAELDLNVNALRRLLLALVAVSVVVEPSPDVFQVNDTSRLLQQAHPYSLRSSYSLFPADARAWSLLPLTLQNGKSAFAHAHGCSLWEYLAEHPDEGARFHRSMGELSRLEAAWLLDAYDWSQFDVLVDVGGGDGTLLGSLLSACPHLHGVLFDRPEALAELAPAFRIMLRAERAALHGGSFFNDSIPPARDAYLLKRIIYSYNDDQARQILRSVHTAMRTDSRLLIIEPVLHKSSTSAYGRLLDLQMLVVGGGSVRDRHALRELLQSASLRLRRIVPTPMVSIIEAMRE